MTSTILLEGLRQPGNQTVWSDYVGRYRPLLVSYARRLGLSEADADDVAQQVIIAFADSYRAGKYDREKGRLRSWLFGIARTTLKNHRRRALRELQVVGSDSDDFFARIEDEDRLSQLWEEEWQQAVLGQCLREVGKEVSPQTIRAFDLFARQGWPAQKVAAELDMSENAVFGAKRRVLRRIRELLPEMEEIW